MQAAEELVVQLEQNNLCVVFAESCTAGLISASLGLVPGVSGYLCGSAVVYREQTKAAWLGVSAETLTVHTAESMVTTRQIAKGVLDKTPEANIALGITGHLGPNAPPEMDGQVFIAVFGRNEQDSMRLLGEKSARLASTSRRERQYEAATIALKYLGETISGWSR